MKINDQIRDEKLHSDINREAIEILASSSCKIHKYEYQIVKICYHLIKSK